MRGSLPEEGLAPAVGLQAVRADGTVKATRYCREDAARVRVGSAGAQGPADEEVGDGVFVGARAGADGQGVRDTVINREVHQELLAPQGGCGRVGAGDGLGHRQLPKGQLGGEAGTSDPHWCAGRTIDHPPPGRQRACERVVRRPHPPRGEGARRGDHRVHRHFCFVIGSARNAHGLLPPEAARFHLYSLVVGSPSSSEEIKDGRRTTTLPNRGRPEQAGSMLFDGRGGIEAGTAGRDRRIRLGRPERVRVLTEMLVVSQGPLRKRPVSEVSSPEAEPEGGIRGVLIAKDAVDALHATCIHVCHGRDTASATAQGDRRAHIFRIALHRMALEGTTRSRVDLGLALLTGEGRVEGVEAVRARRAVETCRCQGLRVHRRDRARLREGRLLDALVPLDGRVAATRKVGRV